jgi:hypothetical protein
VACRQNQELACAHHRRHVTTGATICACAHALAQAGGVSISVAAIAFANREDEFSSLFLVIVTFLH